MILYVIKFCRFRLAYNIPLLEGLRTSLKCLKYAFIAYKYTGITSKYTNTNAQVNGFGTYLITHIRMLRTLGNMKAPKVEKETDSGQIQGKFEPKSIKE